MIFSSSVSLNGHRSDRQPRDGGLHAWITEPFRAGSAWDVPLTALFLATNVIVLLNAVLHHPAVGYDAPAHLNYIWALSRFALPSAADTYQFFSPPLAYLAPAVIFSTGLVSFPAAAKFAQLVNVGLAVGLTFYLLRLCSLLRPADRTFRLTALGLLATLPVYYKSFAFIRPEPLLAFLCVAAVYHATEILMTAEVSPPRSLLLGILLGLSLLTRQQGFVILLAVVAFGLVSAGRRRAAWRAYLGTVAVTLLVAVGIGGWFYIHLYRESATRGVAAGARLPFSLRNQPLEFYTGLGLGDVFRDPIRPSFRRQLLPKFYSEVWGDHECYFLVYGRELGTGRLVSGIRLERALATRDGLGRLATNRDNIRAYLGRVNLLALLPSAVLGAGILLGCSYLARAFLDPDACGEGDLCGGFLALLVVVSFVAYLWWLIRVPTETGDTIKATYLLHAFPLAAVLGADVLGRLRRARPYAFLGVTVALILVALHNAAAFVTRY